MTKNKIYFLVGGILNIASLLALFIIDLVFMIDLGYYENFTSILALVCSIASLILNIACLVLCMVSKRQKLSFMIVIPTLFISMFLQLKFYYSNLHLVLWFLFYLMLIVGGICYALGLFVAFTNSETKTEEAAPELPQPEPELEKTLAKFIAMKEAGLITKEEFDKLKMQAITKNFE